MDSHNRHFSGHPQKVEFGRPQPALQWTATRDIAVDSRRRQTPSTGEDNSHQEDHFEYQEPNGHFHLWFFGLSLREKGLGWGGVGVGWGGGGCWGGGGRGIVKYTTGKTWKPKHPDTGLFNSCHHVARADQLIYISLSRRHIGINAFKTLHNKLQTGHIHHCPSPPPLPPSPPPHPPPPPPTHPSMTGQHLPHHPPRHFTPSGEEHGRQTPPSGTSSTSTWRLCRGQQLWLH